MKKKVRDLTKFEVKAYCKTVNDCIGCKLSRLCAIGIDRLLKLVQDDELNVLLNQEIELKEEK